MKFQDLTLERIELKKKITNNFLNLSEDELNRIIDGVYARVEKTTNSNSEKIKSPLLSIIEAADYLRVKRTTFDKIRQSGKLNCRKIGNTDFFTYEDLNEFIRISSYSNRAMCLKTNIYIEPTSNEILPHKNGRTYSIYKENKIWVYLLSDRLIRLSRKEYNKYFRNAEDWEVAAEKFNLLLI